VPLVTTTPWVDRLKAMDIVPGLWMSPRVDPNATCITTFGDNAFVLSDGVKQIYSGGVGSNEHMWNHETPEGVAGIQAMVDAVYNLGVRFIRYDIQRNSPWREFGVFKVLVDRFRTKQEDVVIECSQPYLQSLTDTMRTNDWFNYDADWDTCALHRFKVALCSTPGCILDCDVWGNNGGAAYNAAFVKQGRLMYGYGRPTAYMIDGFNNGGTGFNAAYANFFFNGTTIPVMEWFRNHLEIPTRELVGDWDTSFSTRLLYPSGEAILYDAVNDMLSVQSVQAVEDHANGDVDLSWSSGFSATYVEASEV
jgi:hypothetical protein